jgi:hypothetical protein
LVSGFAGVTRTIPWSLRLSSGDSEVQTEGYLFPIDAFRHDIGHVEHDQPVVFLKFLVSTLSSRIFTEPNHRDYGKPVLNEETL